MRHPDTACVCRGIYRPGMGCFVVSTLQAVASLRGGAGMWQEYSTASEESSEESCKESSAEDSGEVHVGGFLHKLSVGVSMSSTMPPLHLVA